MYKDRKGNYHKKPENVKSQNRESTNGIFIKNREVLLVKPSWVDIWEFPGGGKEENENILEALKREFREETGFEIIKFEENPIYRMQTKFYADDLDIFFDSNIYFYKINEIGNQDKTFVDKKEIIDMKYISISNLNRENMNNIHMDVVEYIKNNN